MTTPRSRRSTPWRSCVGKTRYRTFRVARWSATVRSAVTGDRIKAYRCRFGCGAFHIGHADDAVGPMRDKYWLFDGRHQR